MDQNALYNRVLDEREGERQAEIQEREQKQQELEALETEAKQSKEGGFLGRPINPNENPNEGELGRALVGGAIDILSLIHI